MYAPLELLGPFARDDQHDQLADPRLERALETQVPAHLLPAVHEVRRAKQRNEGSLHAFPRPRGQFVGRLALRRSHHVEGKRRHAVVHVVTPSLKRKRATVLSTKTAAAANRVCATPLLWLTQSGPAIWPNAKAAVMAAMSGRARSAATRRASCMPPMVITMKVPPTRTAAIRIPKSPGIMRGSTTPSAMSRAATIHTCRWLGKKPATIVDA